MTVDVTRCTEVVPGMCADIIKAHHPDIAECGANVGAIFASNPDGPAVKVHGAAKAVCRHVAFNRDDGLVRVAFVRYKAD